MNKEQLQGLLNQKYNPENWNKIYGSIFPNVMLFASPKEIAVSEQWVKSFRQRGLVRLDGNQDVAIFEVVLQDGISVQSKRVGLRNLVAKLIDEYQNHGVLAVFDNGSPEYRFTFAAKETKVTREGIEKSETDSKRYTYILGETETCKTAAEQFIKLAEKGTGISLTDLRDAFSVEKLSKQFFNEYKEQYNHFVGYLASQPRILKSVFGDDQKKMRDFVKLLLGRLVFLQFVQKKKWLGVPAKNKDWHSGDVRFLVNAFNCFANKDKFYSDYLEELFFECLNNPNRKNELFELSGTKVPFLNGGLFENDNAKTKNLNFPATYFTGLFEFFGKYNFTIDENDPTEKEVGIDPEMLGSIFENLLEDNKDKGAFYTPKEIVHYMCQESLIEYLNTKVNEKKVEGITDSIRVFITKRKIDEHVLKLLSPLAIALKEVKICDPAIGSGAFPMGMLVEIFHAVFELYNANPKIVSKEWNMNGWQPNIVKSNIIQNSIYGVDIEKGAVDIARLRFWLSLIVDEEEPKALPNLDYKIVVGNSLVSKLGDEIIDIDWDVKPTSNAAKKMQQEIQNNLNKLFNTQKLFFDFNGKKENLKAEIRNLKIDLLISQLQLDKFKYGESSIQTGRLFEMTGKEKAADQERKQKLTNFDKTIRELQRLKSNPDLPLNFFDWKLDFPEVMNESLNQYTGFDIVIGNPPYISAVTMARDEETKKYFKEKYPLATGSYDLYLLFILKAINLSNKKGTYTWIIPNKFLIADYAKQSREILVESFGFMYSLNVSKFNVFEGIGVYPIIIFGNKNTKNAFSELLLESYEDLEQRKFILPTTLKNHKTLKEYGLQINAGATGFQAEQLKNVISDKEIKGSIPFTVSGNIDRYTWNNKSVRYMGERYLTAFINNNSNIVANSKWSFWLSPKIVIAGMTKFIEAVYVDKPLGMGVGIYGIYDFKGYDPYCLTAILNSKYLTHYFLIRFKDKHLAGGYLAINKSTIEQFPLVTVSKLIQKKLAEISKKAHKLSDENKNIEHLEIEIDKIVYRLYGLNYDEVKAIDPEFPLSQNEYENISIE